MPLLLQRAKCALTTWPNAAGWRYTGIVSLIYFAIVTPIGFASGLMYWVAPPSAVDILKIMLLTIFIPGIMEETIFRGLMYPSIQETKAPAKPWRWILISTTLFILWHPFNYFVFLKDSEKYDASVFLNPAFLAIVLVLGVSCSLIYLKTRSLWAPIALHWLTVVIWKVFCGGLNYFPL